jgi:Ca2+-binding EF-hand superfamily protein
MVRNNRTIIVNLLLAALLMIGPPAGKAFAQRASTPKAENNQALAEDDVKQLLLLMDTDKNGKISRQEYMKFMQAEFDRMDKDKSGELDAKELAQSKLESNAIPGGDYVKQLLLLMDADKSGKISRQEYMAFMQTEFNRLDEDKNGELDAKELTESRLRPRTFSSVGK